jgi:hypothetical protein
VVHQVHLLAHRPAVPARVPGAHRRFCVMLLKEEADLAVCGACVVAGVVSTRAKGFAPVWSRWKGKWGEGIGRRKGVGQGGWGVRVARTRKP